MMAWLRTTPRPEKQYSGSEESWNTGGEEAEAEEEETEPGGGGRKESIRHGAQGTRGKARD